MEKAVITELSHNRFYKEFLSKLTELSESTMITSSYTFYDPIREVFTGVIIYYK